MYRELEKRLGLCAGSIRRVMSCDVSSQYDGICLKPKRSAAHRNRKIVKRREVFAPKSKLKVIQRRIAKLIEAKFEPHPIAHAYVKRKGILSNAEQHVGAKAMVHLDLIAFFRSIDQVTVAAALRHLFPDLPAGETEIIAHLCCHEGRLPQGSPASPILSNLVCLPFDIELAAFAHSAECEVTRYSDDISFSAADPRLIRKLAWCRRGVTYVARSLRSLIASHGFSINWKKVRLETRPSGLKVTGLIVGATTVSVPRAFRDRLRASLDGWEKEGIVNAIRRRGSPCSADKFVRSIRGRIAYVGQITGKDSTQYQRLVTKFNKLVEQR